MTVQKFLRSYPYLPLIALAALVIAAALFAWGPRRQPAFVPAVPEEHPYVDGPVVVHLQTDTAFDRYTGTVPVPPCAALTLYPRMDAQAPGHASLIFNFVKAPVACDAGVATSAQPFEVALPSGTVLDAVFAGSATTTFRIE